MTSIFFNNCCFEFFVKTFAIKSTKGVLPVPPIYVSYTNSFNLRVFYWLLKDVNKFLTSIIKVNGYRSID